MNSNNGYGNNMPINNDNRYMNRDNNRMNSNSYEFVDYYGHQDHSQIKRIMQEVYNRQSEGIDFHGHMAEQFDFMNLKGFSQWQKEMRREEMENCEKTHKKFMSQHRMLLDPPDRRYQYDAMPQHWYGHSNMELSSEDISAQVRKSLNSCLQWEEETLEIYKQKARELTDLEAYEEYMQVKEMMTNVLKEIETIRDLIMELESVRYDMKHIKKLQEKFKKEYKSMGIRRYMPMRTYKIEFEYEDDE